MAVSSPVLLLPYSAPRKCIASCFVSTGPKNPSVSSSLISLLSSGWLEKVATPHPASQFFLLTLLFSGQDPSVYILIYLFLCGGGWGFGSSILVLSLFHFGSVFCVWLPPPFGVTIDPDAYIFMNSLCLSSLES